MAIDGGGLGEDEVDFGNHDIPEEVMERRDRQEIVRWLLDHNPKLMLGGAEWWAGFHLGDHHGDLVYVSPEGVVYPDGVPEGGVSPEETLRP
jgi:hypothetical protein